MKIVEVGPRDGLQNQTAVVPTQAKIAFVDALAATGVSEIEVSAFVSPQWVPQLADAREVFGGITRQAGVVYSALVPNERGLDRALAAGADKISVFTAASETFNLKNINTTLAGSIRRFRPLISRARNMGLPVRGYVSTAFWCAFEGRIAPEAAIDVVQRLVDIGVDEVSISDTTGKAAPDEVDMLLNRLLPRLASGRIAMHFHDTYGRGVKNVLASWSLGVETFDASAGGLGGCPYAPEASGNVATENVAAALAAAGAEMTVDPRRLRHARRLLDPFLAEERRALPEDGSPMCAACEISSGAACCQGRQLQG